MEWNQAMVDQLRTMVTESDMSASDIAKTIGMTRNAVIGKTNRLGFKRPKRPEMVKSPRKRRKSQNGARMAARPKTISKPPRTNNGVGLLDLDSFHCRAVIGTGKDGLAMYCGDMREQRLRIAQLSPYCEFHGELYYNRAYRAPISSVSK